MSSAREGKQTEDGIRRRASFRLIRDAPRVECHRLAIPLRRICSRCGTALGPLMGLALGP